MASPTELLWPWWVRLSHWLVAAGVIALWLMSHVWYETDVLHRIVGYGVLFIVLLRILLGCVSPLASARLSVPGWQSISRHWVQMRTGQLPAHHGHNPLGQWAVYVIWSLIALLALSGWLSRTDALWGEDWPVDLHALLSWILLAVIVVHVLAVIRVSQLSGQRLLRQMWHGRFEVKE